MSTLHPDPQILELGYQIRRAKLEACGGLVIFPHDLETFCIPIEHADCLADAYKRYLQTSGILEWDSESESRHELYECDRQTLIFFHERTHTPFIEGEFSLEAAIEFVWMEAKVPTSLAIRWCMMMEYVSYEDQRTEELRNRKENDAADKKDRQNERSP